jgi:hypothetical protein
MYLISYIFFKKNEEVIWFVLFHNLSVKIERKGPLSILDVFG